MSYSRAQRCLPLFALATSLAAQGTLPALFIPDPGIRTTGDTIAVTVSGVPNQLTAVLWDATSGPVHALGETLYLGLSPDTYEVFSFFMPVVGELSFDLGFAPNPALAGIQRHLQAFSLSPSAVNGVFTASNPASFAFHATQHAIEDTFDTPTVDGFTGNFDTSVHDVIAGGGVRVRTHRTVSLGGGTVPWSYPVFTPMNPNGSRCQIVFRAEDIGATGEAELVTAIRWRAFGNVVLPDSFSQIDISLSHSAVVPDYTIGPLSGTAVFPDSGLDPTFAQNVLPGETPTMTYSGPYTLQPTDLRGDGYVDYPIPTTPFSYDGEGSLLIDLAIAPDPSALGVNGQHVRLMVPSSPPPSARNFANGTPGAPLDPSTVTTGQGDNAMYDLQIEFARVRTEATSPWRAGAIGADYRTPLVATIEPPGTSVALEYRGADDVTGANATLWSSTIDVADGRAFVQYRITLVANRMSGAVPHVDSIVIPY